MSANAAFAQTMLLTASISEPDARDLVEELREVTGTTSDLAELVTDTNLKLQPLQRKIVKVRHPRTEEWVYTVTSIAKNLDTSARHSISQDKFLELISLFFSNDRTYEYRIDQIIGSGITEKDFMAFLDEGWLDQQDSGSYVPSIRLLVEGEDYLDKEYSASVSRCLGCNNYMLFGRFCENFGCNARTHRRCDGPFRQQKQLAPDVCPKCNSNFAAPNNDE